MNNTSDLIQRIHQFWFGEIQPDGTVAAAKQQHWWQKDAVFDEKIKNLFAADFEQALKGSYNQLALTPQGRLALIILLDQFSRNMFRNTARAFAQDNLALQLAIEGIQQKHDQKLQLIERVFVYLPFEHAEDNTMQQQSVELFETLYQQAPANQKAIYENFLNYAKAHQAVVERFGRFPHRNVILGRVSTADELAFLQQPNSSF